MRGAGRIYATQRQNLFNFFLVASAFLFTAYVAALNGKKALLAATLAFLGALIAIGFTAMDLRNRDLTRAERAVRDLQTRLTPSLGLDSIRILDQVERPRHSWLSIGRIFRSINCIVGTIFIGAAIYAIVQ